MVLFFMRLGVGLCPCEAGCRAVRSRQKDEKEFLVSRELLLYQVGELFMPPSTIAILFDF